MPITSRINQYRGVNAHLHSLMQSTNGVISTWLSFHNQFIGYLTGALNDILPDNYIASGEQSLEVSTWPPARRRPDVTVYELEQRAARPASASAPVATWEAPLETTLAPEADSTAIVIYALDAEPRQHELLGTPVTRIEVLSPSNKRGGGGYLSYLANRREALLGGLPLVEIDLLHESVSPILNLPRYPDEVDAYPYHITISDPRLPPDQAQVRDFGFRVDDPIPALPVPLRGAESVVIDYHAVYNQTYYAGRRGFYVDYALPPERLESYSPADQTRIVERLHRIRSALERGDDLEQGPF